MCDRKGCATVLGAVSPPPALVDPNLGGRRVRQSAAGLPRASNGQVAVSTLRSGRASPTTVIASVHQPLYSAASVQRVISSSIPDPVTSRCTSLLDSTGLCVHADQWSLPPRAALVAGPTRPPQVGH